MFTVAKSTMEARLFQTFHRRKARRVADRHIDQGGSLGV